MKQYINKLSSLIIVLSIMLSINALAGKGKGDYTKPYKQDFNINKGATLIINTEFTDIKAFNWDKDIISIEVNINVDARNQEKAEDKFRNVTVQMSGSSSKVELSTELHSSFFGKNSNNNIDIEVVIYYPAHIHLELNNEFGGSIFENIDGNVEVEVSYGSFTAEMLTDSNLDLDVEFGSIKLQRFQAGKVHISYGSFDAQVVGDIDLHSEFSSIDVGLADRLKLNSAYDKNFFDEINYAHIETDFSSLRIDKLSNYLQLKTSYGSLKIGQIKQDFEMIDIESEFTGINLNFPKNASFAFQANIEMGDFDYPKESAHITSLEKEMMELNIGGYFGNAKGDHPKLKLDVENAGVEININ